MKVSCPLNDDQNYDFCNNSADLTGRHTERRKHTNSFVAKVDWTKSTLFVENETDTKYKELVVEIWRKTSFNSDTSFVTPLIDEDEEVSKLYNSDTEEEGTYLVGDLSPSAETRIGSLFIMLKHRFMSVMQSTNQVQNEVMDLDHRILEIVVKAKQFGIISKKDKIKLADMIRENKGIPKEIRKDLWMLSSGAMRAKLNNPDYYIVDEGTDLFNEVFSDNDSLDKQTQDSTYPLLSSYKELPDIHKHQIYIDLKRTFSDTPEFLSQNPENQKYLSNILRSYAKRNVNIGYCQGMNYIAATLFRVLEDEEDTFWAFCSLLESIIPLDYYSQMIEVIVDQKVFIYLLQRRKPFLFKHLNNLGMDFAIILFQWIIWVFSSQLNRIATETIWDFLMLEGTVTIFRAAFAILSILEEELLECNEFWDIYTVLNSRPWEAADNAYVLITHLKKFTDIEQNEIDNLRNQFRPDIAQEQKRIWQTNARSKNPWERDTPHAKAVKLLYKFPLLENATHEKSPEIKDEIPTFDCSKLPLWMYDFTIRAKINNYFCFKVANSVKVIDSYFGEDDDDNEQPTSYWYIFHPQQNPGITAYDTEQGTSLILTCIDIKLKKLISTSHQVSSEMPTDDSLLMTRETHICTNEGFTSQFQKLFAEKAHILFHNMLVFESYEDEIKSEDNKDTFMQQLLASREFDKIRDIYDHAKNDDKFAHLFESTTMRRNNGSIRSDYDVSEFMEPWNKSVDLNHNKFRISFDEYKKYVTIWFYFLKIITSVLKIKQ